MQPHRVETGAESLTRNPGVGGQPVFFPEPARQPLETVLLDAELGFYRGRSWCLNAYPTTHEVAMHLREELARMDDPQEDWQRKEVMTNVFLLCCAVTDTVDDYLLGERFDFSRATAVIRALAPLVWAAEVVQAAVERTREWRLGRVRKWREAWGSGVVEFLKLFVAEGEPNREGLSQARDQLTRLLGAGFPADVQKIRPRVPAGFRSQDLTHFDVLALGRQFTEAYPDRGRPILVVGVRTTGSYYAPLLNAWFAAQGYRHVEYVTFRPKRGPSRWEGEALKGSGKKGGLAVIVDEPPDTGGTLAKCVYFIQRAGFPASAVVALLPIHPTRRDWARDQSFPLLSLIRVLSLEPEQYHKRRLLDRDAIEARLSEYFGIRNYSTVQLVADPAVESLNLALQQRAEGKFHTRLMRIYGVRLERADGRAETRYVLAKSVGWGWLGYHAFVAAERLSTFVPPVLGLRDGILYTEWLLQNNLAGNGHDRRRWLETAASYVAARVRRLPLEGDLSPDLGSANQYPGRELLARTLSQAYGRRGAALKRHRLAWELARHTCPFPTLVDGRMHPREWVAGSHGLLKTDFEHHGQGKHQLNVTDPAYDLAEAILFLDPSEAEEDRFISRYIDSTGDSGVRERLFFNKILAGTWARSLALMHLADGERLDRAEEFNELYIRAWNFLIAHTARACGGISGRPAVPRWDSPLVVMDIDGVLDTLIFGFPTTSAAGLRAVSLLHAHGVPVAVNTARPLSQVKEYCRAYGFVGGVADYGAVVWNALDDRERILVDDEALRHQLEAVRHSLRQVPGVFLNEDYTHSIRAYTYDCEAGKTVPLPTLLVRHVLSGLKADRLDFHQTHLDSAIISKDVDKGRGLLALLELVGRPGTKTIAIGDSGPDLAMFRVADHSFAPSHNSCGSGARLLGCRIVDRPFQVGLLRSVRSILHPNGGRCDRCRSAELLQAGGGGLLFWRLLEAADHGQVRSLLQATLDPMALRAFAS